MIKIQNAVKRYQLGKTKVEALKGVTLEIKKGEIVCIMGPSGSGKSTLLNMIGCLDKPDSGEITVGENKVTELSRNKLAEIRLNKIGFIFQTFNLIPVMNVFENIEFPLHIKNENMPKKEKNERIMKIIEEVGLKEYINHKPDELSGGQRQRVAIARALITKPEIILADEPTANLDSNTSKLILELMAKINKEERVTFVFSTHDPSITQYATNIFKMKDGMIVN